MVQLNATKVQSEDDLSGRKTPLPGRYHVIVESVDESFDKFDKVIVEFKVVAGTTPGQDGRTITEYFSCTEKALDRLTKLAIATGLLRPGEARDVSFNEAEGRQLVIEVEAHEYETKDGVKKEGARVSFLGMWSVGNPAVADVPKNEQVLKALGGGGGNSDQAGGAAASGGNGGKPPAPAGNNGKPATGPASWDDI